MTSALIGILSALGTSIAAGIAWCMKKKSRYENVNFRCRYNDNGCMCGCVHENTELEERIKDVTNHLEHEKDVEMKHQRELYEKDLELNNKDHMLRISELEYAVGQKNRQIDQMNKVVDSIRNDFLTFRSSIDNRSIVMHDVAGPPQQIMKTVSTRPTIFSTPTSNLPELRSYEISRPNSPFDIFRELKRAQTPPL